MSYIEKNLMNGESVLYRGKLHWVVFLWPVIWFIVAIMFFSGGGDSAAVGGLFVLIAIVTGVASFISYTTSAPHFPLVGICLAPRTLAAKINTEIN